MCFSCQSHLHVLDVLLVVVWVTALRVAVWINISIDGCYFTYIQQAPTNALELLFNLYSLLVLKKYICCTHFVLTVMVDSLCLESNICQQNTRMYDISEGKSKFLPINWKFWDSNSKLWRTVLIPWDFHTSAAIQ